MKHEPRRAQIGTEQEAKIAGYALDFRDMNRTKLAEKIQAEVKWPGKPPEIEVLERKISSYRKDPDLAEDRPWTLDSLRDHPLPPEALPKVFQIWFDMQASSNSPPVTIREAKWIARFSGMTDHLESVRVAADTCAQLELIGELTQTPQLSSASTMYLIYSLATRMPKKAFDELAPLIAREKIAYDTARKRVTEILRRVYGDEFVKDVKSESKKEAKDNERKPEGENQEGAGR